MENRRPQLNLAELQQLKWLLGGVLAVIAAWTVFYMDVAAWPLLALITLAAPVVTWKPALVCRFPGLVYRLAFPALLTVFAADMALHFKEPLPPVMRLALMLVLYRVVTPRRHRDDLQLVVLGLFLVVVGGVMTVSIVFAAQIVAFTACALVFLLLVTLTESMERGKSMPSAAGEVPAWMRGSWRRLARRLRECVDWRVAMAAGLLFGGVVGLSAVLFMALPRVELGNSVFFDQLVARGTQTGFSESMQFGDIVDIKKDTSVALSVDVSDPSQIPAQRYWRMLVLDDYSDGGFHMSAGMRATLDAGPEIVQKVPGDSPKKAGKGELVWTFYMEAGTSRFLPLLGGFRVINFDGKQAATYSRELGLVRLSVTPAKMFAYRVEGMAETPSLDLPEKGAKPPERPDYDVMADEGLKLKRPEFTSFDMGKGGRAELAAWVKEIGAPKNNAGEFARRVDEWLWQRHTYSLQSQIEPGKEDPLVRWIASKEPGHCELFAGAFTLLAREAGYPARVVLGFKGGDWNARGGGLTVRNSDAHAWCEIFDRKDKSWLRVDPTPGSALPGAAEDGPKGAAVLASISKRGWSADFEALRFFWYRRIVNFDQGSQRELAHNVRQAIDGRLRALKQVLAGRLEALEGWVARPWDLGRIAGWAWGALAVATACAWWRWRGRGAWLRWRSARADGKMDPVRREAGRWLKKVDASGLQGIDLAAVRAELERLRYGPPARRPEPLGVFKRAKRALGKRGLQAAGPRVSARTGKSMP